MIALKSYILLKSSPRISSSVSTRKPALASVNTIGGLIFSTLWNGPSVLSRMPRSLMRLAIYEACAAAGLCVGVAMQVRAANDKFTFPADYASGVEYLSVDKPNKQVHVFYASRGAIEAAKAGKPMPDGTVFTGVHYNAKLDADGNPVKDANGRFIRADLRQYAVMRKVQPRQNRLPV